MLVSAVTISSITLTIPLVPLLYTTSAVISDMSSFIPSVTLFPSAPLSVKEIAFFAITLTLNLAVRPSTLTITSILPTLSVLYISISCVTAIFLTLPSLYVISADIFSVLISFPSRTFTSSTPLSLTDCGNFSTTLIVNEVVIFP